MQGTLQPDRLDLALQREIRSGERLMWHSRQIPRLSLRGFGMYLFAIPWTGFALLWTAGASFGAWQMSEGTWGMSWLFPLFGVPFIAIGLGMLAMPFLPLFGRGRILFALTDQRLIKIQKWRSLKTTSVSLDRVGMIERIETRDGSGSLKIAIRIGTDSDGDKTVEHFEIGEVANVIDVETKLARLAQPYQRPRREPTIEAFPA